MLTRLNSSVVKSNLNLREMNKLLTWYNNLTLKKNNNHRRSRILLYAQTKVQFIDLLWISCQGMKKLSCHQAKREGNPIPTEVINAQTLTQNTTQ
jgi:hypothetical protein